MYQSTTGLMPICIMSGIDQEGAEFIDNKQANLLTHKHADTQLYLYVLVRIKSESVATV